MGDDFLLGIVGFLALLGVTALGLRLLRTIGRAVLGAAEEAAASGVAESSARRGDLTRMTEARAAVVAARARRRRSMLAGTAIALWLILPIFFGAAREAWALAAPLWLVPGAGRGGTGVRVGGVRVRGRGGEGDDPSGRTGEGVKG